MSARGYRFVAGLARWLGIWVVALFAWVVSTGYFLFLPRRLAVSLRFYRALFPERGTLWALCCAWRQYHDFAAVFADRLQLDRPGGVRFESEGGEHLEEAARSGRGAVLVMSHVGNWEVAARLLRRQGLPMLLFLGVKSREQVEQLQKADLARDGVEIVTAVQGEDNPFNGIAGLEALRSGRLVSIAADRIWTRHGETLEVRFLGHEVQVTRAPFSLALIARAPLIFFFTVRTGRARYRFVASPPVPVVAASRSERNEALQRAAQSWADALAEVLRRYPSQWHLFEPFLGPRIDDPD